MAVTAQDPVLGTRGPSRGRPALGGWVAALACWAVVTTLLVAADVALVDVLVFTVWAVGVVVVPGTVLWRLTVPGPPRPLVLDAALGGGLGYCLELLAYLPARAAGAPLAHLLLPAAVVVASLAVPTWRARAWRRGPSAPVWWSWSVAALVAVVAAFCARALWFPRPLDGASPRQPYPDQPYHLSLVGELRHHLPADVPFVSGEPLLYHWFVHAEVAATSWSTGIEPVVLLERLSLLPMIVLTLVGAGAVVHRLTGSWAASLVPPLLLALAAGPVLPPVLAELYTGGVLYLSPTTTFAQVLLPATLVLLATCLRDGVRSLGAGWLPLVLLLVVASGAKGSLLPVVGAGVLAVAILSFRSRRTVVAAGAVLVVVVVSALVAQALVYGGGAQGVGLGPLTVGRLLGVRAGAGVDEDDVAPAVSVLLALVWLVGWVCTSAAGLLLVGRATRRDPAAQLLVMVTGAGLGAVAVLASNSGNQLYFARVVPVAATVAAGWGLHQVCGDRPRRWALAALSALAGVAVSLVVLGAVTFPGPGDALRGREVVVPWAVIAAAVLVVGAVAAVVGRRSGRHGLVLVVVAAMVTGTTMASGPQALVRWLPTLQDGVGTGIQPTTDLEQIGPGGIEAARWLRDHSSPDDLVATDQHCRRVAGRGDECDNRTFWVSAYSERRTLVEGWAYTARNGPRAVRLDLPAYRVPFWDQRRLSINDAAFERPTERTVERLRATYGVRWLVVNTTISQDWRPLRDLARERFRSGDYVVLELGTS